MRNPCVSHIRSPNEASYSLPSVTLAWQEPSRIAARSPGKTVNQGPIPAAKNRFPLTLSKFAKFAKFANFGIVDARHWHPALGRQR